VNREQTCGRHFFAIVASVTLGPVELARTGVMPGCV
jgi:hypothetical protein